MRTIVNVSVDLDISAELTWEHVLSPISLCWVASPVIHYFGRHTFPETWYVGAEVDLQPALFGTKPRAHHLRIVAVDPERWILQTEESGDNAAIWNHTITVESLPDRRSRYTDYVDIEAAPHVCGFAHLFYRHRQRRWRKISGSLHGTSTKYT